MEARRRHGVGLRSRSMGDTLYPPWRSEEHPRGYGRVASCGSYLTDGRDGGGGAITGGGAMNGAAYGAEGNERRYYWSADSYESVRCSSHLGKFRFLIFYP